MTVVVPHVLHTCTSDFAKDNILQSIRDNIAPNIIEHSLCCGLHPCQNGASIEMEVVAKQLIDEFKNVDFPIIVDSNLCGAFITQFYKTLKLSMFHEEQLQQLKQHLYSLAAFLTKFTNANDFSTDYKERTTVLPTIEFKKSEYYHQLNWIKEIPNANIVDFPILNYRYAYDLGHAIFAPEHDQSKNKILLKTLELSNIEHLIVEDVMIKNHLQKYFNASNSIVTVHHLATFFSRYPQ